jgi:hypothetical protein
MTSARTSIPTCACDAPRACLSVFVATPARCGTPRVPRRGQGGERTRHVDLDSQPGGAHLVGERVDRADARLRVAALGIVSLRSTPSSRRISSSAWCPVAETCRIASAARCGSRGAFSEAASERRDHHRDAVRDDVVQLPGDATGSAATARAARWSRSRSELTGAIGEPSSTPVVPARWCRAGAPPRPG